MTAENHIQQSTQTHTNTENLIQQLPQTHTNTENLIQQLPQAHTAAESHIQQTAQNHMTPQDYMRLALQLARKGEGRTSPNPMVGCVVVKDGKVISTGYHEFYGGFHAERNALLPCRRRPLCQPGALLPSWKDPALHRHHH